jgi:hypothetical protein
VASKELAEIMEKADKLPPEEQLELVSHLVEKAKRAYQRSKPENLWRDAFGIAKHPLAGEDAQTWVTRTRRESDERREQQLREARS